MDSTAVVILNYNGLDYLKKFLPSVIENSPHCKIVVIDNHSQDHSVSFLQQSFPQVQLVLLDKNYGYSGGYNRGLTAVEADIFILLNSDVKVTPGWTKQLIDFLQQHKDVGICQPKILSFQNPQQFDYAGAAGGFIDFMGYPFCRGRIFHTLEEDRGQYDQSQMIFWAGGACMAIRNELFRELGGFDEDFFAHMEEIDLCWRSQRLGHKVAFVGGSKVYHVGGGTLSTTNPLKTYLNFKNGFSMLLKNTPLSHLWWKIPFRIVLDAVAALRFLFLGDWSHCWAVLKAEVMFLYYLPKTWGKRSNLKYSTAIKLYERLIIWDYFVKGRKSFKKLNSGL